MCGIFAYLGTEHATPYLLKALERMEYRGYDSAGVAVMRADGRLGVVKRTGKVSVLRAACEANPEVAHVQGEPSRSGIAHTRWATHGKPSDANSHPHLNESRGIAVVHNGIIENYATLKAELVSKGYRFASETDTELLAHLVEDVVKNLREMTGTVSLSVAVSVALSLVQGTFGVVFLFADQPDVLIGARKGSPLILGVGPQSFVLASDAAAVVEHTKSVVYLNDGDIVEVRASQGSAGTYRIRSLAALSSSLLSVDECATNPLVQLEVNLEQIEKGGYKHFMLKEIMDQGNCIANTLRGRLAGVYADNSEAPGIGKLVTPPTSTDSSPSLEFSLPRASQPDRELHTQPYVKLGGLMQEVRPGVTALDALVSAGRIIVTACGTSWHSGLIGEYLLEQFARTPVEVEYASEFRYRDPIIFPSDVVVAVSQSGETADTLEAVRIAKSRGATTLGIVNVVGSTIARETHAGIYLHAGPEIGVASTKAFTSQVTVLLLLALAISEEKSKQRTPPGCQAERQAVLRELVHFPSVVAACLADTHQQVAHIAKMFRLASNFLFLGRGIHFPVALEAALKLKEISYIHAEGYPAAEMKHGPIALIDTLMPVVVVAPRSDPNYDKVKNNIEQVKARSGELIIVTEEGNHDLDQFTQPDLIVRVPVVHPALQPVIAIIPLQLLAYHIADLRGCSIDQPRNLAKSVTVE